MSLGTPHYMSPEQAMGEREITARSDVYALGVVLYEMLTGDPPFTGSTAQAIVARVLTETPRPILPQRHTIPPAIEAAVLTALEKLPADRFGSAAEFAEALSGRGSMPATRTAVMPAAPAAAPDRKHGGSSSACSRAAVVAAAVAAWGWLRPGDAPQVNRFSLYLPAEQALAPVNTVRQPGRDLARWQADRLLRSRAAGHPALGPGARPAHLHTHTRDRERGHAVLLARRPPDRVRAQWYEAPDGVARRRPHPVAHRQRQHDRRRLGTATATCTSRWTRGSRASAPRAGRSSRSTISSSTRRSGAEWPVRAARRQGAPLPNPPPQPTGRRLPDRGHAAAERRAARAHAGRLRALLADRAPAGRHRRRQAGRGPLRSREARAHAARRWGCSKESESRSAGSPPTSPSRITVRWSTRTGSAVRSRQPVWVTREGVATPVDSTWEPQGGIAAFSLCARRPLPRRGRDPERHQCDLDQADPDRTLLEAHLRRHR